VTQDSPRLEDRLDRLAHQIGDIETRLGALEESLEGGVSARRSPASGPEESASAREAGRSEATGLQDRTAPSLRGVTLVGRTLIALAGAFLLRAITDAGVVTPAVGVGLGMAYAISWVGLADREGGRGRWRSATFHGATSAMVAFPLFWEVVARFGFLSPAAGAMALGVFSLIGLAVAWRRHLRGLAWIMVGGASVAGLGLALATGRLIPFGFGFLVLGLAVLWVGYDRDWHGLSWPHAWLVDVVMFFFVALYLSPRPADTYIVLDPAPLLWLLLAYLLGFLGSVGARTLLMRRDVTTFEIIHTLAVLLFGLGGAILVQNRSASGPALVGPISLALAFGLYALAFLFLDRRLGRRRNFVYYTSLALVFALVAGGLLLRPSSLTLFLAAGAVLMAWMGGAFSRVTLSVHCAAYAVAAAVVSGMVLSAAALLFGSGADQSRWFTPSMLAVLAALLLCAWFRAPTHARTWGRLARLPKLVLLGVALWGLFGLTIALVLLVPPVSTEGVMDRGVMAVIRTAILALAALGLALAGRSSRFREATWLVYPVLALGALKLLVQDLPQGRPLTLFLSLALFGGALILAPRVLRRAA
jgi:hypothetical protein